jgi:hypothetical protein
MLQASFTGPLYTSNFYKMRMIQRSSTDFPSLTCLNASRIESLMIGLWVCNHVFEDANFLEMKKLASFFFWILLHWLALILLKRVRNRELELGYVDEAVMLHWALMLRAPILQRKIERWFFFGNPMLESFSNHESNKHLGFAMRHSAHLRGLL